MGIAYIHQIFLWFYLGTHNWHEHTVDELRLIPIWIQDWQPARKAWKDVPNTIPGKFFWKEMVPFKSFPFGDLFNGQEYVLMN